MTIPLPPLPQSHISLNPAPNAASTPFPVELVKGYVLTEFQLRAIQREAMRVAIEAAARVCEATYQEHKNGRFVTLPQFDGGTDCADAIRALEIA